MKRLTPILFLAAVLAIAGCAGLSKGPTDESMIRATTQKLKLALEAKNIDKILETFAPDFSYEGASDKNKLRAFLQQGIDMGYLDGAVCNIEGIEIKFEADKKKASVFPVDLSGNAGAITIELIVNRYESTVDGKKHVEWLISSLSGA